MVSAITVLATDLVPKRVMVMAMGTAVTTPILPSDPPQARQELCCHLDEVAAELTVIKGHVLTAPCLPIQCIQHIPCQWKAHSRT